MRGSGPDRRPRRRAVFKHHKPANKRPIAAAVGRLAVSEPQVGGGADGLFGAVVEVVAKTWADVALELDGRDQTAVVNNENVPQFRGPEIAGQRDDASPGVYLRVF